MVMESMILLPISAVLQTSDSNIPSQQQTKILKPGRYVYDAIITTPFNFTSKIIEGMALVREGSVLSV